VTAIQIARRPDPEAVERILRELPDWFGIEDAIVGYAADARRLPSYLAIRGEHEVVGICLVRRRYPESAELHLIAVSPDHQGDGVGSALVAAVEADLGVDGARILQVHTVGPAREDAAYARTRQFYRARGFVPLQEFDRIDWDGPTLVLVKALLPADTEITLGS